MDFRQVHPVKNQAEFPNVFQREEQSMQGMKFTIVGAGSSYTPELLEEMALRREQLPVAGTRSLYDIR